MSTMVLGKLALILGLALATQGIVPGVPAEPQVRRWAEEAARQASGGMNPTTRMTAFVRTFRQLVSTTFPDYDSSYVTVHDEKSAGGLGQLPSWPVTHFQGGITIGLVGPLADFEQQSAYAILDGKSPATVTWLAGPAVFVMPHGPYALDIVKVIVESNGAEVAPLDASQYATPTNAQWVCDDEEAENRLCRTTVNLHGGHIVYPASAFATGQTVKVTVVSSSGWKRVKTLSAKDLRKLR
jgi:hypothetical protein